MAAAFPSRLTFPEAQPSVCVTFFTCVGTNVSGTVDLVHTYAAAVTYLEAQRSAPGGELRYELVWLDNGGSAREHEAFLRRGAQFEVARRNPTNQGLFRAVNDAWFRGAGCSAPYVLSLEDDRVARRGLERSGVAHLRLSIELLRRDPHLSGVRLKDEWSDEPIRRAAERDEAEAEAEAAEASGQARRAVGPSGSVVRATALRWLVTGGGERLGYARHCMTLTSGLAWRAPSRW